MEDALSASRSVEALASTFGNMYAIVLWKGWIDLFDYILCLCTDNADD